MKKKTYIIIILLLIVVFAVGLAVWYKISYIPYKEALAEYNSLAQDINIKNEELDSEIKRLEDLIDTGKKPLDENIITTCNEILKEAKSSKVVVEEPPQKTIDIIAKNKELSVPIDYSENINKLKNSYIALDNSIKQYEHFLTPTEEFIIQRLSNVDEIVASRAVTEDNDPNGKLNKAGGYTATIFFTSSNVDQNDVVGEDIIEKGTRGGGSIEVYANEDDAKVRNEYLSGFDGGFLDSGSHKVVGTVVIRTSDELTATQQDNLETKIIDAIAAL